MCTVLLPTGDNPITINKYIKYQNINKLAQILHASIGDRFVVLVNCACRFKG